VNKLKKYFLVFLLVSWAQLAHSYILNQTKNGTPVHWPSSSQIVDIYVNSQNRQSLDENTVQSIATTSLYQWNNLGQITIRKNATTNIGQRDLNELFFTTDSHVFNGTAVIGLTQVDYNDTNGEIIDANIMINDNTPFSTNPNDLYYLGNVITHEAGHFLGLGHGQVVGSTMFYALSRGQFTVESDDKAGLYSMYPNGNIYKGTLTGTVVGGKNLASVFGAHVQAISVKTGKVTGASISELNGRFHIDGLDMNDQYLIYTSPISQLGLPANYANAKSDFCEASKKYRGSFFQSCGSSSEGFPQAIRLSNSQVEIGKVTIRCGLDSPPEYMQTKSTTPAQFDVNAYSNSGLGGSFVGSFSSAEILSGTAQDFFRINLSGISDWNTVSANPLLYVHLKILNQVFYSPFKANVSVTRSGTTTAILPKYFAEPDGRLNLETNIYISINRVTSSDNDLEIKIVPEDMRSSLPSGIPYTRYDYFPSMDDLADSVFFYLATADIVKSNGDGTYTQVSSRNDVVTDNANCPDAINTYALTNFSATGNSSGSDRKKAAGCGTVDMDNGASGGPGGFMVGLLVSFILAYALSRYSKMA
jgi:hypothetical protein